MGLPADIPLQQKFHKWSFRLATVVGVVAVLVLIGWYTNVDWLKRMGSPVTAMYPLTAVFFLCIAGGFYFIRPSSEKYVRMAAYGITVAVLGIALFKLCSTIFKWNGSIDEFLYGRSPDLSAMPYTRMSPSVSLGFMLATLALLLLHTRWHIGRLGAQVVALFLFILGLLALLGYLYEAEKVYGIIFSLPMALHTAMCFVFFSIAVLFYSAHQGLMAFVTSTLSGSILSRILIPAAIIVPSVFGFIVLSGYHRQQYNVEHGFVYFAIFIILVFVAMVAYNAFLLNKRDLLRTKTERALQNSEQQLQRFNESLTHQVEEKTSELTEMFERVTDGFIALDKHYCYTYINKKAGQMIHKDPASLIGKCVWDVFPDVVGSATYTAFQKAMSSQEHVRNTDYYQPLDLWQENNIYPSHNGLSIFIRDITQQMKKEQEVTEARALADKLIDSLPGVFYFYDANGKFIRWNKQLEEVTGYSSDEIAAMHPVELFAPEDREYITERIGTVFEKGINDAEANFLSKSGERTTYYFRAALIQYNGVPCLLGSGIDITERKKVEKELKTSEQQYKLLFERNPLPMWMLSLPGYRVIDVNIAGLQQYGYGRDEFLSIEMKNLLDPLEIPRLYTQLNTNFRGLYYPGVWRHQKKDGTIIYTDIVTHDIYYHGNPVRLVLATEVTEQYKAEEKLRQSYDEVKQLTEYLQKIREEERMHISHEIHDELGQLLTVLKMDISWINKRSDAGNAALKAKINDALQTVDTTITSVRRIASELRPALLDDLGLSAAMQWHIKEFEKRSNIAAVIDFPEEEPVFPVEHKTGLYRILQESLTNVSRHSGADTVNILMRQSDDGHAVLTITDNGKGFDTSKRSRKTLGLLGMKERAQAMGGFYTISSTIGKGTSVTVSVPMRSGS